MLSPSDPMQLVDELSMIYTASLMCYATFSFSKSQVTRVILGVGLLALDTFITVSVRNQRNIVGSLTMRLALLSLLARPRISPKRIRDYYSDCPLSKYVCDGG